MKNHVNFIPFFLLEIRTRFRSNFTASISYYIVHTRGLLFFCSPVNPDRGHKNRAGARVPFLHSITSVIIFVTRFLSLSLRNGLSAGAATFGIFSIILSYDKYGRPTVYVYVRSRVGGFKFFYYFFRNDLEPEVIRDRVARVL